jgi:ribose transport system substrate-binding protein
MRSMSSLMLVLGLVLGACGGGGTTGEESASARTSQSPEAQSGTEVTLPEGYESPEARGASTSVDTSEFAKDPPWKLGVSAGYLSNSWVVFALQHIRYEVSLNADYDQEIIVTDANFDPSKQVSDIEDLLNQGVDAIIYWPIDDQAIEPALERAVGQGVPTVNVGGGYSDAAGVGSNAYIDQYILGVAVALQLMEDLGGEGKIVSMLPIAGTTAAVDQDQALRDVLEKYPNVELLDTQNGDWNRAKAKTITESWLQQYPEIDGVFSPAGQMSAGVAEAFDEAGRLDQVTFSPGDEYNGWLKWIAANPESNGGVVTFPPSAGGVGVQQMTRILQGEEVTKGIQVPSVYYPPDAAASLANQSASDDSWASGLPEEFLP